MTQRYFIALAYDGTHYHGWQIQPNAHSVQQSLQEALTLLLRQPISITGAGRTDTGVHAAYMVAHMDCDPTLAPVLAAGTTSLVYKLGKLLPRDITIYQISPVPPTAHARFDAKARTYHYYINTTPTPFIRAYAYFPYQQPDFARMNAAAALLCGQHDFTSFSKVHTDVKTNLCEVHRAVWVQVRPGIWRFEITADRFLRNMVRAIVGTLLAVGLGKRSVEDIAQTLSLCDRCAAGESAPAHGLFLVDISYPETLYSNTIGRAISPLPPTLLS